MKLDIKLTDKQAMSIAEKINDGGFFIAGFGCFDITIEDYAEIIKLAFNEKDGKISSYYDKINPLR